MNRKAVTVESERMDRALAERPVTIVWRKRPNGILRAVYVDDPHGDPVGSGSASANYQAWQRRQRSVA